MNQNKQLFIKGLPSDTTNEEVENFFSDIGPIKRCFIVTKKNEKGEQQCSGIGYVYYALSEHAEVAIKEKNNKQFKNKVIQVSIAKERLKKDQQQQPKQDEKDQEEVQQKNNKKQFNIKNELAIVVNNFVTDKNTVQNFLSLKKGSIKNIYSIPFSNNAVRIVVNSDKDLVILENKLSKQKEFNGKKLSYAIENDEFKSNEIIIRNLSFNTTAQNLIDKFSSYGDLVLVKVPTKPNSSATKGFAFLTFKSKEASTKIITECNGQKINGRQVAIDWTLKQNDYETQKENESLVNLDDQSESEEEGEEDKVETQSKESDNEDSGSDESDSEDEDQDSDSEGEDQDNDSEDEEMDYDDDDEEEEEDVKEEKNDIKKKMEIDHDRNKKEVEELKTLFIRNLAFDTKEEDLGARFEQFGKLEFCRLVLDRDSGKPTGKAFVKYQDKESAKRAMEACSSVPLYDPSLEDKIQKSNKKDKKEKKKNTLSVASLLQGGLLMDGRYLIVDYAVDHKQAHAFKEKKVENVDRKNRHLLLIGKILQGSVEGKELTEKDWELRSLADKENQTKLKVNPNYFVSPTRLCFRNLPLHVTDSILKNACIKILKQAEIKEKVLFCKVAVDSERITSQGIPKSKGYGFVEFSNHQAALEVLHKTNNNNKIFFHPNNPKSKDQRLFVQFAVEDARAVKKQKEYQDRVNKKKVDQKIERALIKKQAKENGEQLDESKKLSRGQRQREKKRQERLKLESQGVDVDQLNKQKELQKQKKQLMKELKEKQSNTKKLTQVQKEKLIKESKQQQQQSNNNNNNNKKRKNNNSESFDQLASNYLNQNDNSTLKKKKWI